MWARRCLRRRWRFVPWKNLRSHQLPRNTCLQILSVSIFEQTLLFGLVHPRITLRLVFTRVRLDLGSVDGHVPQLDQARLLA